ENLQPFCVSPAKLAAPVRNPSPVRIPVHSAQRHRGVLHARCAHRAFAPFL
ncbi:hypothetical protein, partial [Pseudomonas sp. FG-3G]